MQAVEPVAGRWFLFTGMSYDNTVRARRHHVASCRLHRAARRSAEQDGRFSWLILSDVCKHCARAGCLEVCPTGAIIRTEFDTVYVQPDVCNGCGYCVVSCPFGVIDRREDDGRAWKCTLCYDRLKDDMEPACAKACPTDSIKFGEVAELRAEGAERASKQLHERGVRKRICTERMQPSSREPRG